MEALVPREAGRRRRASDRDAFVAEIGAAYREMGFRRHQRPTASRLS